MIQVTPQMKIMVALHPADFRKGIDGIARLCRAELESDPFSGTMFVFRNRRKTAIKVLVYDGQGFWLCHKRLSSGKFNYWPKATEHKATVIESHELTVLIFGGDPSCTQTAPIWRRVKLNENI